MTFKYLLGLGVLILILCGIFLIPKPRPAIKPNSTITIATDPQYLIVNESDLLKDKINWSASEEEWNKSIKPVVKERLQTIRHNLGPGTKERVLGWSIIIQYMDYPLDSPTKKSPYAVMTRRLLEISEEMDFPLFIPLNGFQWWNQLPELWNWWDSGPDQIEGCQESNYRDKEKDPDGNIVWKCKFPELRDAGYRKKFAKAYNPENKWNVEWTDWNTPSKEGWRNWGGGFFQIAPIPNLVDHGRTKLTFRSVQRERLALIYEEIYAKLASWEKKDKLHLFAGLSIGTEVSLHSAARDKAKFEITGYRALQDVLCEKDDTSCGEKARWSLAKLKRGREEIIRRYFEDLSKQAIERGIPRQRIYTHVWSENVPPDAQFVNYFAPSINEWSRPGLSLYGYADKPFELAPFQEAMKKAGYPTWGAPEFNIPQDGDWERALDAVLNSDHPAKLVDIYNWNSISSPETTQIIRSLLLQVEN